MAGIQVQARMPIVQETTSRVVLRHQARGAVFMAIGLLAAIWAVNRFIPPPALWFSVGVLGLMLVVCVIGAVWNDELELDLATRQWRRRAGFVGAVKTTRGAIDDFPEVTLSLKPGDSDNSATWDIGLRAPQWKNSVILISHTREEDGYAALEKWARLLRRDAVDGTGERETRSGWQSLDASLVERARVDASEPPPPVSPHPPPGSRILVLADQGKRRILLPAMGWSSGATFMTLFGLAFLGIGGASALVGAHVITGVRVNGSIPDGPVWGIAAAGTFFALIGLLVIVAMIVGSRAREWIEDGPGALTVGYGWGGFDWSEKRLPKRAIEGVDLSVSPATTTSRVLRREEGRSTSNPDSPKDVRIRSDQRVVRLGRYLPAEDQRWLHASVEAMVRGG